MGIESGFPSPINIQKKVEFYKECQNSSFLASSSSPKSAARGHGPHNSVTEAGQEPKGLTTGLQHLPLCQHGNDSNATMTTLTGHCK